MEHDGESPLSLGRGGEHNGNSGADILPAQNLYVPPMLLRDPLRNGMPSPVPPVALARDSSARKNRSKIFGTASGAIPMPSSCTVSRA